jgi:hypothetical protein
MIDVKRLTHFTLTSFLIKITDFYFNYITVTKKYIIS